MARHLPAALALAGLCAGLFFGSRCRARLSIELKDVAADRMERQRSFNEGALPLPGTPNVAIFDQRLKDTGVTLAAPMLIRVFKTESELEVWKEREGQMVLFATYPICHWSGTLGPKLKEGDKQAPEGFYTVTKKQLRHAGRWPRSLLLNFPNAFDQTEARTGSDILIHGGCTSVGCFAMTNPVSDEIHRMATAAIDAGQEHLPIHVFPFRMTQENLRTHQSAAWQGFWGNLKERLRLFRTHQASAARVDLRGPLRVQRGARPRSLGSHGGVPDRGCRWERDGRVVEWRARASRAGCGTAPRAHGGCKHHAHASGCTAGHGRASGRPDRGVRRFARRGRRGRAPGRDDTAGNSGAGGHCACAARLRP